MSPLVKRRILGVLAAGAVKWTLTFILIEVLDFWVGLTTPASWTIGLIIGTAVGLWILIKLWRVRPSDRVSASVADESGRGKAPAARVSVPMASSAEVGAPKSPGIASTVEAKLTKQSA